MICPSTDARRAGAGGWCRVRALVVSAARRQVVHETAPGSFGSAAQAALRWILAQKLQEGGAHE